jgi:polysaccharide biosynthesis transport protein
VAVAALRGLISAKAEGRTDLLKISFRHRDPVLAAEFLNLLANAFVATQADLVQVPGAQIFFQQQTKRLEAEAEKAGADLRNFSVAASIYSVADQRTLLLKRADDLGNLIASTRGAVEDRKGQKQAILDQLMILRPVYQSRTVTGIVNNLRGRDHKEVENSVGTAHNEEAPPLLLVKVYQDAMANLLKVNTELNGSLRVEKHLVSELEKINAELASLSSREAEYDRLKRVLTRASAAADHYGSRVIEEDINQDIAKKTQLSSVRVIQLAEKSVTPVFPRAAHIAVLAIVGGIALGSAIAVMLESRERRREEGADGDGQAIEEIVKRSVRSHLREIQAAE